MRKLFILFLAVMFSSAAYAGESQFGFVTTTDLLPQGDKEIEQWLTWRTDQVGGQFNLIDSQTGVQYGITSKFQVSLYAIYDWTMAYHNGPGGATTPPASFNDYSVGRNDHFTADRFVGVSSEEIYRILSPYTDLFGLAIDEKPTVGPKHVDSESKIIVQKNFLDDTLITALNWDYAPTFSYLADDNTAGESWQEATDITTSLGVSYRFMENWSAGVEFQNETLYNSFDFTKETDSAFEIGPTIHYGGRSFYVTAVFLDQLPWASSYSHTATGSVVDGLDDGADFQKYLLRIKVGFQF
jgi:hypothetical protein